MTGSTEKDITTTEKPKASSHSPPLAVLPLNSSTKLDQEPNPFEQSFSGAAEEKSPTVVKLPPVASITSPAVKPSSVPVIGGGILPKEVSNQFTWDTLRTGPLSPSMLQGPANPEEYYASTAKQLIPPNNYSARSSFSSAATNDIQYMQQQPQQHLIKTEPRSMRQQRKQSEDSRSIDSNGSSLKNKRSRRRSSMMDDSEEEDKRRTRASSSKEPEDDEKRKNFLERNRIAALKCRQRKKQWLNNLQAKVEFLSNDNERLQVQSDALKEEIVNLKTLLLAHKECPVAQSNGFHASSIQKSMPGMLTQQQHMIRNSHSFTRPPPTTQTVSSSSMPRYQRGSMVGLPTQGQQEPTTQQGMIAGGTGGSSSVLRF